MAQDTALLRYLLKGARRAPGSGSQRDLAFTFDGTDDYISSNATIGRTGYDMTVSGNVSTGSDVDGSYFDVNGNFNTTGTKAECITTTSPNITHLTDFSISCKFKLLGNVPSLGSMGLIGRTSVISLHIDESSGSNVLKFRIRNGASITEISYTITLGTLYNIHGTYNSIDKKMYFYVNGVLQNPGGTVVAAATFGGTQNWILGDSAVGGGVIKSTPCYIYNAVIYTKTLTQAEIDADIALGNTSKNDPSIVAYYIPDNLQYNTQYITQPKALDQSPWGSSIWAITPDYAVAPDGTTTADRILYGGGTAGNVQQTITTLTGSNLASKTFIIKAFVKSNTGSHQFRFRLAHNGVADYLSGNMTTTTTRQEFTFVQTFTSSTAGTGIDAGFVSNTTLSNPVDISVRNVRVFLVNEYLRDESPNIGGYLGRKQNEVISARIKPSADATGSTGDTQCFVLTPYYYGHLRTSLNNIHLRFDTKLSAIGASYALGSLFRDKVHILGIRVRDGSKFVSKGYVNGVLVSTANGTELPPISSWNYGNNAQLGRKNTSYFSGNIRDARVYTFTGSFTDADALAIYNGGEPISSGVTKYLHYRPPVGEVGTTTQDQSSNDRDGTLNNGVTRDYI